MLDNIFFYLIFTMQLLSLSYFLPREVIRRAKFVLDNYPAQEYPKLYSQPEPLERRLLSRFQRANTLIIAMGLLALVSIAIWDASSTGQINEGFPSFFSLAQWLPFFYLAFLGFKRSEVMRKMNTKGQRKASIIPRSVSSFISPWILVLAVFTLISYVVFEILLGEPDPSYGRYINILTALVSNAVLLGLILWYVYGKKLDPFQDTNERHRQIGISVKVLVIISIVSSAYFLTNGLFEHFQLHHFRVVFNSFHVLALTLLALGTIKSIHVEDIDFSVYKAD